jgi:hypothetical protein
MLKENCNLNVIDFMSSAQLAHNYMLKQGVFDGVLQLSSYPTRLHYEMYGWW